MPRIRLRRTFALVLAWLVGLVGPAFAEQRVTVVESSRISAYEEALAGFKQAVSTLVPQRGLKSVQAVQVSEYVLSEEPGCAALLEKLRAEEPDLILAIGAQGLACVTSLPEIPILYVLVPAPQTLVKGRTHVTGVGLSLPPRAQLQAFIATLPGLRRLGVIYDPGRSGPLVKKAAAAAKTLGLTLVALEAGSPKQVPARLASLAGEVDAFWMLPDLTVVTPQTVEQIFLFSLEHTTPVLTFSDKYLDMGAAVAVSFDTEAIGLQAGEMARKLLGGTPVKDLPPEPARRVRVDLNRRVLDKLGVSFKAEADSAVK